MITPLLALTLLAPADSPIEPVDEAFVELFLSSTDAATVCDDIAEFSDLVDTLGVISGGEDLGPLFDMAVSYWQDSAEEGVGPTAAMTAEAETTFRSWVYDCGGRIEVLP